MSLQPYAPEDVAAMKLAECIVANPDIEARQQQMRWLMALVIRARTWRGEDQAAARMRDDL